MNSPGPRYGWAVSEPTLPLVTRLWFSVVCLLRVLLEGAFAARVWAVRRAPPALPAASPSGADVGPLQLLALLQREGRLVDFLEQDITGFGDAEVGAAARVVHEGCRRALAAHATLEPVRDEQEDSRVEVPVGFDPSQVKLTGNVAGQPPYRGVLRHRGWRIRELRLPEPIRGHDFHVVAPAEVEL